MAAEFTLDTSGSVVIRARPGSAWVPSGATVYGATWDDLTPFQQGYVEAMLSEWNEARLAAAIAVRCTTVTGHFRDLHPEALARIMGDCEQAKKDFPHADLGHTGSWFWEKRQTGTWPHWPPLAPYLNDEGRVCLRERDQ